MRAKLYILGTYFGQVCDFVFGRGICCNGISQFADSNINQTIITSCSFYDCFSGTWKLIENIPSTLLYHSANKIIHKGRDHKWMISGGQGIFINISFINQYKRKGILQLMRMQLQK